MTDLVLNFQEKVVKMGLFCITPPGQNYHVRDGFRNFEFYSKSKNFSVRPTFDGKNFVLVERLESENQKVCLKNLLFCLFWMKNNE